MRWRALGASTIGTTHTELGLPCQDAHAFITEPVLCLVVSDGAGSRPMSHVGSQAAVNAVVEHVQAVDWQATVDLEALMTNAFVAAREAMAAAATGLGLELRDVAATLGVVIDTPAGRCVGQVGDCFVFLRSGGVLSVVAPAPRHEFANITEFLTDPSWQDTYRFTDCSDLEAEEWAASTDGLRYKILKTIDPAVAFEPFFEDLFAYCRSEGASSESVAAFLTSLGNAQTGDDLTLVVATREAVADLDQ